MLRVLTACLLAIWGVFLSSPLATAQGNLKIAAIYSLTGPAAPDNLGSVNGVRCAVDEINRKGGLLGMPLELVLIDNKSSPIGSHLAALEAVRLGVTAIIGSAWSSHSLAVAKVAQANQVPMITNVSTHPQVTMVGDYIFRVCFTDSFQGKALAWLARDELKADSAVLMVNLTSDYSMELGRTFREAFQNKGGRVSIELTYKQREENFKPLLEQAQKVDHDLLVLTGHHESAVILKQAREVGIKAVPIGGDGWESKAFYNSGGSELKHGYFITHWAKEVKNPLSRNFVEKCGKVCDVVPSTALAYDAVSVLADAIGRAESSSRSRIREALAHTRSFSGVTGKITFDRNGDPIDKSAVIMAITNGESTYYHTFRPK